jgi:hypothetical protein
MSGMSSGSGKSCIVIENARIGGKVLGSLVLGSDGTILPAPQGDVRTFDAGGRVVVPAFAEPHAHLDRAFSQAITGAPGRKAQATAYLPDGVPPVLKPRAQRLQCVVLPLERDAELLEGGHCLLRPGALRSDDAVEPEPEVVHPGLRMAAGLTPYKFGKRSPASQYSW